MECLGCKLANGQEKVYTVYENDEVTCILDRAPFTEGHVLILSKKHVVEADDLDDAAALAVMQAVRLVSKAIKQFAAPDGITICQNGGIFNELSHFHMHVVPRTEHQAFSAFYAEGESKIASEKELSETQKKLEELIRNLVCA